MNWFSHLKTAYKLALGFGLCLLLAAAVGALAIVRMRELNIQYSSLRQPPRR